MVSNIYVQLSAAAGASNTSYTFTFRKNYVNTDLTLTITGTNTSGFNITNSVRFLNGDILTVAAIPSATQPTDNLDVKWTSRLTI